MKLPWSKNTGGIEFKLYVIIAEKSVEFALLRFGATQPRVEIDKTIKFSAQTEGDFQSAILSRFNKILREIEKDLASISAKKQAPCKLRTVYCFYSKPFGISKAIRCKIEESKSFTVSKDRINKLLDEQEKLFLTETGSDEMPHIVIERNILGASINGYGVADYLGREAAQFETDIMFGAVQDKIKNAIETSIHSVFRDTVINAHTLDSAIFTQVKSLLPEVSSYLYCIIEDNRTTLTAVKNDIPIGTSEFSYGSAKLFQTFAQKHSMTREVAESHIRLSAEGKMDSKSNNEVQELLLTTLNEWSNQLMLSISNLTSDIVPPKFLFILPSTEAEYLFATKIPEIRTEPVSIKDQFSIEIIDDLKIGSIVEDGKRRPLISMLVRHLH